MEKRLASFGPTMRRGSRSMSGRRLTPEEESLPDADDDFDDTLPSDLWFRSCSRSNRLAPRHNWSASGHPSRAK